MKNNILIIGGCGYIGSVLYEDLKKENNVDTVDLEWFGNFNNTNNYKVDFDSLSKEFLNNYNAIIFVAANSSVKLCEDTFDTFNNNVVKFYNLVKKLNTQKFIYASSSCVYVTGSTEEKTEDELLSPLDGLTLSKTTIDNLMKLTNIEYYGLRFGSVNGWSPNMRLDLMINAMTVSAIKNKEVNVFNGHAHRPILSINDLSRSVKAILDSKLDNRGIYNISSFNDNILEIGKKVANYTCVNLKDLGKTFTYDFAISTKKFEETFNFKFDSKVSSIVNSITDKEINDKWSKRETIIK